jgi:hypothetical protein
MNNTNHYGFTAEGALVNLGVAADHAEVANVLADNAESVAGATGKNLVIVSLLTINDLYRLKGEIEAALNSLDNEALGGEVNTFGLDVASL